MSRKKDELPRGCNQKPCDCNGHFLYMEKNGGGSSASAEEPREEKHRGEGPSVAAPHHRPLRVCRGPVGSAHFCSNVNKKQNPKQDRDAGFDYLFASCLHRRILMVWRLSEGHSQKHNGKGSTECSDYVKRKADVRSAHCQHGEWRRRNCAGAPSQIHDT